MILENFDNFCETFDDVKFLILKDPTCANGFSTEIIPKIFAHFPNLLVLGTERPSFDPEQDGGILQFHRQYFTLYPDNFLVELLNLEDERIELKTKYFCLLNPYFIADTDAIPCCPVLIPEQGFSTR